MCFPSLESEDKQCSKKSEDKQCSKNREKKAQIKKKYKLGRWPATLKCCFCRSYPSDRWVQSGFVVLFVRIRLCRLRRRMQPFGYYNNSMQQIELIIHTNIQPLKAIVLPKVKVIGLRFKKIIVNALT